MKRIIVLVVLAAFLASAVPSTRELAANDELWHGRVTNAWDALEGELNASEAQEASNRLHMIALTSGASFWNASDLNWLLNAVIDTTPKGYTRTLYARGLSSAQSGNPLFADRMASWIAFQTLF